MKVDNVFRFPGPPPRAEHAPEAFDVLARGSATRIERIVSWGHASPAGFWYDQSESEWVMVLSGAAELQLESEEAPRRLVAGDHLLIPARVCHRVEWTTPDEPTIWLAVFFEADPTDPAAPHS